jgi:hypothetical protein
MTTITLTDADADFTSTTINKAVGAYTVSFSGGYGNDNQGLGIDTYDNNQGVYAYQGPEDQVQITLTVNPGYTFDINSFGVGVDSGQLAVSFTYGNGSTNNFTQNLTAGVFQTLSSFSKPLDDVKQVVLSSNQFGIFQNFGISDIKAIVATPTVTDGNISIVSTGTGTGGTYKIGDTVTAQWDNTATGDNNAGVTGTTMDFSQFGGGSAVSATNSGGVWTASYTLVAGAVDATGRNVSVSATNTGGTTTTADSTNLSVDNVAPTTVTTSAFLSADTGASSADFITSSPAQTIAGTLSASLSAGDTVQASLDNGATWGTADASGSSWSLNGVTLAGSNTLRVRVSDAAGNLGPVYSHAYTLDTTAPAAPSTPDMTAGTDTGTSNSDSITSNTTPAFTGTAEAGSTVTLYDTDGTTILGTAATDGSGAWSMTSSTLSQGSHTLTAKATDAAGNVSIASTGAPVSIDTVGPTQVALSTNSVSQPTATSGSTIATFSASDANSVTYGLAVGNGVIDADNGRFTIAGNSLQVAGQSLTAGTYHLYASATDAAGNASYQVFTVGVTDAPTVSAVVRTGGVSRTVAASTDLVSYDVNFSQAVTGVDASDFSLTATGTAHGFVSDVTGSGAAYTVTVDGLSGDGTLRLDLNGSGTGIQNDANTAITGGYTAGATYTLDHTAPAAPVALAMDTASDTGSSHTDSITSSTTPTFTGIAEANSTVKLYDRPQGQEVSTTVGVTTADGNGAWSITPSSPLAAGNHTLNAKARDEAGNVSAASTALNVSILTAAPQVATAQIAFGSSAATITFPNAVTVGTGAIELHSAADDSLIQSWSSGHGLTTAGSTASITLNRSALAPGAYYFTAAADAIEDIAGNASTAVTRTANVGFTIQPPPSSGGGSAPAMTPDVMPATVIVTLNPTPVSVPSVVPSAPSTAPYTPVPAAPATTPPSLAFDPSVSFKSPTQALVSGTIANPSSIAGIEVFANMQGGPVDLGAAALNPDGTWTLDTDVGEVLQSSLFAVATDTAGNTARSDAAYALTTGVGQNERPAGQPYTAIQDHYDADGNTTGSTFFRANGSVLFESTDQTMEDGSAAITYAGGSYFENKPYASFTDVYGSGGDLQQHVTANTDGSHTVEGFIGGLTLQSQGNDTFQSTGGNNTFAFTSGFGHDTIANFVLGGPDHDTIQLPASAQGRLGAILGHATSDENGDAVLHLRGGDSLTVQGVSVTDLRHHKGDFGFAAA